MCHLHVTACHFPGHFPPISPLESLLSHFTKFLTSVSTLSRFHHVGVQHVHCFLMLTDVETSKFASIHNPLKLLGPWAYCQKLIPIVSDATYLLGRFWCAGSVSRRPCLRADFGSGSIFASWWTASAPQPIASAVSRHCRSRPGYGFGSMFSS